jgi:hypothetical protein
MVTKEVGEVIGEAPGGGGEFSPTPSRACFPARQLVHPDRDSRRGPADALVDHGTRHGGLARLWLRDVGRGRDELVGDQLDERLWRAGNEDVGWTDVAGHRDPQPVGTGRPTGWSRSRAGTRAISNAVAASRAHSVSNKVRLT